MNDLDKLRELDKSATRGPWLVGDDGEDSETSLSLLDGRADPIIDGTGWTIYESDLELIALMRNMLPKFLELVDVVSRNPCRHSADVTGRDCDTCKALRALKGEELD